MKDDQEKKENSASENCERNSEYPNLLRGGVKGNKGGGRTPRECRDECRRIIMTNLGAIEDILKKDKARDADRIAAWKALADKALPAQTEDVTEPTLEEKLAFIQDMVAKVKRGSE